MTRPSFSAVILAGGAARRLGGGDKPLRLLAGKPILEWIIERIQPQLRMLAISANGNPSRFSTYALPVLPDLAPDLGPMAGIVAAMDWTYDTNPTASHVLTLSGDTPFLPSDLVERLSRPAFDNASDIVAAASAGQVHPTIALWPMAARQKIQQALTEEKGRRVSDWLPILNHHSVEWDHHPFDPFFNVNTPDDLQEAEKIARLASSPFV